MNHAKMFAIVAMASALGMFGCNKPEGVYTLDKEEMKKAVQAESTDEPGQELAQQLLLAMVEELEARLELESGGAMTLGAQWGAKKEESKKGTWKKEGGAIVLELDDERIKCSREGSTKLTCGSDDKDEKQKMVFVKTTNK